MPKHKKLKTRKYASIFQINIFSLQVQSCQVSFTALGFFSLDIALISSVSSSSLKIPILITRHSNFFQIVGTVMTYLVILIQFESSETPEKS